MENARTTPELDPRAMQEHAGKAAQLLKALANERRLQILCVLAGGERAVGEINALLDLSQSALSQHLAVLREEGCQVDERVEESEFGLFGWVMDPDGNRIELWQPPVS